MRSNQFGFIPGRSTMEPILCITQLVEKYKENRGSCVSMIFIDLEKTYNKISREILKWALKKKGLFMVYVNIIK